MGTKSQDVAVIAPVCCAATMLVSTRLAVREMAQAGCEKPVYRGLTAMAMELTDALEHLDAFRELYDQHLGD